MIGTILYSLLFLFSLFFQGTMTSLPLMVAFLLPVIILVRSHVIFLLAFIIGVFLDVLLVRPFGQTGLFLVTFVFLVLLYDRKFEIASYPFVFFASFLGSICYLLIIRSPAVIVQALLTSVVALLSYRILRQIQIDTL